MTTRLEQLLGFLEDQKDDSFLLFAIAKEYEGLQDYEQAEAKYQYLKSIDPNYVGLYFHLAALQVELGKSEEALKTYQEGIDIAKSLEDLHALSELQGAKTNLEMEL